MIGRYAGFAPPETASMIIRVSEIREEGLDVERAALPPAPFADRTWRLDDLHLHVERDGNDVVVTGDIDATVPLVCSRCCETFPLPAHADVDARFIPRPDGGEAQELGADDLDLDFYDHDELNVAALVETETTLALPMKPLCRPDCRGLCPVCGGNRNAVACACETRAPDPRLAALRDLAARSRS
jgi:uncharacterized protein